MKSEYRVVCDSDRFVFALVANDAQNGAEDLFLRDRHAVADPGKHGRTHKEASLQTVRASRSADDNSRALFNAPADVALHTIEVGAISHGADDRGRICRVADSQLPHDGLDLQGDFRKACLWNKQPR